MGTNGSAESAGAGRGSKRQGTANPNLRTKFLKASRLGGNGILTPGNLLIKETTNGLKFELSRSNSS